MSRSAGDRESGIGNPPGFRRTSEMTASSAQVCRDLEWRVGARIATPGKRPGQNTEAIITAIGDRGVLARLITIEGVELDEPFESLLDVRCRDWIFLSQPPAPSP